MQNAIGEKYFKAFSFIVLLILFIFAFLPFILIFVTSFTDEATLIRNGYSFFPQKLSLDSYEYMFSNYSTIVRAYGVSIFVTSVGTAVGLLLTTMLAYPMARKDFKYRNLLAFIAFFTLLFNGGIVPSYIMWTRMFSINNSYAALIIPIYLMNAFNVLLVRNYYANNVPVEVIESAKIDGAGELMIFFRIMLPMSVPVVATVGLFTGLAYWNDWINALYYISSPKYYGIQNLLIRLMNNIQFLKSSQASTLLAGREMELPSTGIRMALAVLGILPILILYPFLQKYLIKGVVMGAVKG
ncbi:MAG TPA: sugar ABC transporter permease [Ruminiclostridium sp.]|jgi:putative aldouronate transport system permease protein|nr:carbohydrate ABC transporter permease [Clostridiaceae bacterium]HAA26285.1 sugar ABC transporter permease [Ruminiclostridium sp.]